MRLQALVFMDDKNPRETLADLIKGKKTGRFSLDLSQGGACKQVEWREKVRLSEEQTTELRSFISQMLAKSDSPREAL